MARCLSLHDVVDRLERRYFTTGCRGNVTKINTLPCCRSGWKSITYRRIFDQVRARTLTQCRIPASIDNTTSFDKVREGEYLGPPTRGESDGEGMPVVQRQQNSDQT